MSLVVDTAELGPWVMADAIARTRRRVPQMVGDELEEKRLERRPGRRLNQDEAKIVGPHRARVHRRQVN